MTADRDVVFHVHHNNTHLPSKDALMSSRPEFQNLTRNQTSSVRRWQCVNSGYMIFILVNILPTKLLVYVDVCPVRVGKNFILYY